MTPTEFKEIYGDSAEIAAALRHIADDANAHDSYWLLEAAVHIEGMYLWALEEIERREPND